MKNKDFSKIKRIKFEKEKTDVAGTKKTLILLKTPQNHILQSSSKPPKWFIHTRKYRNTTDGW